MRISVAFLVLASVVCTGYCQMMPMDNPLMMMNLMRSMGGGGGMTGMPTMDLASAPIMDPQMFAKMAKIAALMGNNQKPTVNKTTMANKGGKGMNALRLAQQMKQQQQAEQAQSSGFDPMMMYMMTQQNMDPMLMALMSSMSKPSPAASTSSSGGIDPMTMMYLMQSGGGGMFG